MVYHRRRERYGQHRPARHLRARPGGVWASARVYLPEINLLPHTEDATRLRFFDPVDLTVTAGESPGTAHATSEPVSSYLRPPVLEMTFHGEVTSYSHWNTKGLHFEVLGTRIDIGFPAVVQVSTDERHVAA